MARGREALIRISIKLNGVVQLVGLLVPGLPVHGVEDHQVGQGELLSSCGRDYMTGANNPIGR